MDTRCLCGFCFSLTSVTCARETFTPDSCDCSTSPEATVKSSQEGPYGFTDMLQDARAVTKNAHRDVVSGLCFPGGVCEMADKTARTKVALPAKQQASAQPLGSVRPNV